MSIVLIHGMNGPKQTRFQIQIEMILIPRTTPTHNLIKMQNKKQKIKCEMGKTRMNVGDAGEGEGGEWGGRCEHDGFRQGVP